MKKVSVIIPNYNGMQFLPVCMEALRQQTFLDFELVIVDNASTDGSVSWLRENCPEARLLINETNEGFSGAVNQGILDSKSPYVLLLNNDTEVTPNFVGNLVRAMERSDKIFSVSSKMIQYYDHSRMDDAGDLYMILGWAFQRGVGQPSVGYQKRRRLFASCAGAAMYRRELFDQIGLFDRLHFAYLEDIDIGYRARIHGYSNEYCPEAVAFHVGSGTSGSKYNDFKVRLAARNSVYLNYKNMPLFQRGLNYLPLKLGFALKKRFFRGIGFGQAYLDGLAEGMNTRKSCTRVPFRWKHFGHYCKIELELIGNLFIYTYEFTKRKLCGHRVTKGQQRQENDETDHCDKKL